MKIYSHTGEDAHFFPFLEKISVRMKEIIRTTRSEVQLLKYDKDGCLMLVEPEA